MRTVGSSGGGGADGSASGASAGGDAFGGEASIAGGASSGGASVREASASTTDGPVKEGGPSEGGSGQICTPGEPTCDRVNYAGTCNPSGTGLDGPGIDCRQAGVALCSERSLCGPVHCIKGQCEVGLVAYWPFDETTSDIASDLSGNGNYGTLINVARATRKNGGALEFGGSGSYVDVGDKLNTLKVPFTVAAWIFVKTPETLHVLLGSDAAAEHTGFWISQLADRWQVNCGDGRAASPRYRRSINSNAPLPARTWVHIAAVVSGPTDMHLFVNGSEVPGTLEGTGGAMVHTAAPFLIGSRDFGAVSWDGLIDELRIYDHALDASEIATLAEL